MPEVLIREAAGLKNKNNPAGQGRGLEQASFDDVDSLFEFLKPLFNPFHKPVVLLVQSHLGLGSRLQDFIFPSLAVVVQATDGIHQSRDVGLGGRCCAVL